MQNYTIAASNSIKILNTNEVKLNSKNIQIIKSLTGHNDTIKSVAISQDSRFIVSGSADKSLKIWDRESGNLMKSTNAHNKIVSSVAIS